MRIGVCTECGEGMHYQYPCKCDRELKRSKVITLCGSTKFKEQFEQVNRDLTLRGHVVISVGVFGHSDGVKLSEKQKEMLDNVHLRKINMSDEIFVINVGGYIGSSTRNEIEYATKQGKFIQYLESIEKR